MIDEILAKLPKAGLYMRCNDDGFWNCGYDKTVHHNGDRDLYAALKGLYEKLKDFGYEI